jgi:hypothetical protein
VRIVRTIAREALPWRNRRAAVPVMGMTSPRGPEAWIDQLEERILGESAILHDAEVAVADFPRGRCDTRRLSAARSAAGGNPARRRTAGPAGAVRCERVRRGAGWPPSGRSAATIEAFPRIVAAPSLAPRSRAPLSAASLGSGTTGMTRANPG